jgi:hypothetical protein
LPTDTRLKYTDFGSWRTVRQHHVHRGDGHG